MPRSQTPARSHLHGHSGGARCCLPPNDKASALAPTCISGLNHAAYMTPCERFAAGVTPGLAHHSVPAGGRPSPDGVGYPQGFKQGFEDHVTSSCPPLTGLFPAHHFLHGTSQLRLAHGNHSMAPAVLASAPGRPDLIPRSGARSLLSASFVDPATPGGE